MRTANQLTADEGNGKASRGLGENLTHEQKEIFEKFDDCWDEYVSLAEAAIFEYAFALGRGWRWRYRKINKHNTE